MQRCLGTKYKKAGSSANHAFRGSVTGKGNVPSGGFLACTIHSVCQAHSWYADNIAGCIDNETSVHIAVTTSLTVQWPKVLQEVNEVVEGFE